MIIGITGQVGSYMTEFLLGKGYRAVGTSRTADRGMIQGDSNHILWLHI